MKNTERTYSTERYAHMKFQNSGRSGLRLPKLSLGGWNNFDQIALVKELLPTAFDRGITYFDFANNYGPPPGVAEMHAGNVFHHELSGYRDELIIATKAGYTMWPGPYGVGGSKKYLISSVEQSLKRLQLEYVDIFYSHRYDPDTPLEETMEALATIVRQGKALYVGISNYGREQAVEAAKIMKGFNTPLIVHQCNYSMLRRDIEHEVLSVTAELGMGMVAFSPLAQGLLTGKYLAGIPSESRAAKKVSTLDQTRITPALLMKLEKLNEIAKNRGQTLARMALTWVMRDEKVTSTIIGASSVGQLEDNLLSLNDLPLTKDELTRIDDILKS